MKFFMYLPPCCNFVNVNLIVVLHSNIPVFCFPFPSGLGAAALNDKLYVCGGYGGVSSLSSVECYDPETNQWQMVTNMGYHRCAAGVTMFDGHIYALGGHDGLSIFSAVRFWMEAKKPLL